MRIAKIRVGVDVQLKRGVVAVVMDSDLRPMVTRWLRGTNQDVARGLVDVVSEATPTVGQIAVGIDSPRCPLTRPRDWYWEGRRRRWRPRQECDSGSGRHCEVVLASRSGACDASMDPCGYAPGLDAAGLRPLRGAGRGWL